MRVFRLLASIAAAALVAVPGWGQAPPASAAGAHEPVAADWRSIPDDEILLLRLAGGREVVIRLAAALVPEHVTNIRKLARAGWWNGASVYRVQENWVTQWGDATDRKPLPPGVRERVPPEFEITSFAPAQRMARPGPHAAVSGITADGWPVAGDGAGRAWLVHCYGMVGVARGADPTSGSGAELFTPIGQSARRLDRNYAVIGRVVEGMAELSGLPRSDAPMGFYASAAERVPIVEAVLASDLPAATRPRFAYRAADNPRFAAALRLKETPPPPMIGSGAIDVCEMPLEVRRLP